MVEIKLCYNPFKVESQLYVRDGNEWIPISKESGLLRISKMRMQRWLELPERNIFFDNLREALGEDEIMISFSGTTEDKDDLQKAVKAYCEDHSSVNMAVKPEGNTENNSSENKLKQLRDIISEAKKSDYSVLLPNKTLSYLDECLYPKVSSSLLVSLPDVSSIREELLSPGAWQMICLTFAFEDMRSKNHREWFKCFAKELNNIPDRSFERERFLFLCTYDSYSEHLKSLVYKLFTEYGMWDMNVAVISKADLNELDNLDSSVQRAGFVEAQRHIRLFNDRYADQYRLRKMHDVLKNAMIVQGYRKGPSLTRKVDEALRDGSNVGNHISDATVRKATDWIVRFYDAIDRLIDVEG